MGVPAGVSHVVFGGALPGGEVWESGFWIAGAVPTSNSEATALAQLVWDQITATDGSGGFYSSRLVMATTTTLQYAKAYCYVTGGSTADYIGEYTTTAIDGTGANVLPNQCALVVSLRSAHAGRRNRGRMYLPANGLQVNSTTGQLDGTSTGDVSAAWGSCFSDWNASGDNGIISVVSRVGAGAHVPVTDVIVDSIIDTQRRRRNKLTAAHLTDTAVTS